MIQCFYFSADHLPLEREKWASLPLNSGTIVVLTFSVTCIPYINCFGFGIVWGEKIFQLASCFMLFKLSFGIKIRLVLTSRGNLSEVSVTEFCLQCSPHLRDTKKNPFAVTGVWPTSLNPI